MKTPGKLPRDLSGRSFTLAEAAGLGRGRLQGKDLLIASRGIRVPWGVEQDFQRAVAPLFKLSPESVACLGTAARLWRLPLPAWMQGEQRLHLARVNSSTVPRRFGVVGHRLRLSEDEISASSGIPLTGRSRTWLDLAALLSIEELVAVGDALVNSHRRAFGPTKAAWVDLADLVAVVRRHSGARGVRNARIALALVRVGADSAPETYLRLAASRVGLPEPELNVAILDESGCEVAWPDLAFREFRVAIQYDGAHHLSVEQQASDARRDNASAAAGWISIRISRAMVQELGYQGVMRQLVPILRARGWEASRRVCRSAS
ncbi:endonuclease domain-containing protein [Psychromicrobium lacuslunae]|uniref:DUF559 domain-containing protein n=1 Tax=Psychromicrobium lacuslunae TaxID=1618207 RepID=A0A0D4C0E0_9MICC|nr:hypothetical protein [Psychromicrobium lacuslunae]AJT42038.1 hypothetical protein UM93_11900 [Psychromicrobium lacuslunae]